MKTTQKNALKVSALASLVSLSLLGTAQASLYDALKGGKAFGDFRLRYENVEQDNARRDADALTLRSRLGYTTGAYKGFTATVEVEDNRIVLGQGDFSLPGFVNPPFNGNEFSVIADQENTELDQGFIQYKADGITVKAGRQVITNDGQRFIGHVGWRQDRQTYDAIRTIYSPTDELTIDYSYVTQRNRIFGEDADFDSNDHFLNVGYKLGSGKLTGYAYLLDNDDTDRQIDTYGIRYAGKVALDDVKVAYQAEYATQDVELANGTEYDADYYLLEAAATFSGITAKLGYEVLGSDDGAGAFQTPLATLHKFQGWADQFLNTPAVGIEDMYIGLSGSVAGGKLTAVYHTYEADEASSTLDDLGDEINISYVRKFAKHYTLGIKYAAYSADDFSVDTDKAWVWLATKF